MNIASTVLVSIMVLFLVACSKDAVLGKRPDEQRRPLSVAEATVPAAFGRVITVRGTIDAVCQEEGCWMVIRDGDRYLRMTFADEAFTVPLDAKGEVLVEGIVRDDAIDEAQAKAVAPTIGMTPQAVAAMQGDQRVPMMVATGVLFQP